MKKSGVLFAVFCFALAPLQGQTKAAIAPNGVLSLLQAARYAVNSYEATLARGDLLGPGAADNLSKGRSSVREVRSMLARLEANPETFNSPAGFSFIIDLDEVQFFAMDCKTMALLGASNDDMKLLRGTHSHEERAQVLKLGDSKLDLGMDCLKAEKQVAVALGMAHDLYSRWLDAIRDCAGSKSETK